jgi:hypothetical protein
MTSEGRGVQGAGGAVLRTSPARYAVAWMDRDTGTPRSRTVLAASAEAAERGALRVERQFDRARNVRVAHALDDAPTLTRERAVEVYDACRAGAHPMGGIGDACDALLTEDERRAVAERWDAMPGSACWWDAFNSFRIGSPAPYLL